MHNRKPIRHRTARLLTICARRAYPVLIVVLACAARGFDLRDLQLDLN